MNRTAVSPSQEEIKAKFNSIDWADSEVKEWNQALDWQNKVETVIDNDHKPYYLVSPQTKVILSQLVNLAHENYWQILPTGNGTKISWGKLIDRADLIVSTAKLDNIIDHAVDDLTVTVESGVKLADLQRFLATKGQFLPIDPCFYDSATIGGIVATANTGSWRQRYGGVRDLILGLSFIRADGQESKAGGKVVKNVAGYDLMKLFTGSYGSLGIITEVTFRLYPIPEASGTIMAKGSPGKIKTLQQQISSSSLTPTAGDLLSASLLSQLNLGSELGLILRFQSISESVTQQLDQFYNWSKELDLSVTRYDHQEELTLWNNLREKSSDGNFKSLTICKVGILPSEAVNLLNQFNHQGFINISTGIGQLLLNSTVKSPELRKIREFCQQNGGYLTILNALPQMKKQLEPWGYTENMMIMMQKLKQNFDPHNVFVNRL